jgi:hypothetical protein
MFMTVTFEPALTDAGLVNAKFLIMIIDFIEPVDVLVDELGDIDMPDIELDGGEAAVELLLLPQPASRSTAVARPVVTAAARVMVVGIWFSFARVVRCMAGS